MNHTDDGSERRIDLDAAVRASEIIDADHPSIVAMASDVIAGIEGVAPQVTALFDWVRDEIAYDMAPDLDERLSWRASDTLSRGWGFCQQKAVLLAALVRSIGVPAVLAFQSVIDHSMPDRYEVYLPQKRMRPHGLAAVFVDGMWQRLDPSLPRAMCDRRGLLLVEWTPGSDAVLPDFDVAGAPHCDIEADYGLFVDLPDVMFEETMALSFLHTDDFKHAARRNGRSSGEAPAAG